MSTATEALALQACEQAAELLYRAQQQQQTGQSEQAGQGLLLQALSLYQQVNQAHPELVFPYLGLAYVLFSQGKREAAFKALDTALALEPSSAEVIAFKAHLLSQKSTPPKTPGLAVPEVLVAWEVSPEKSAAVPMTPLQRTVGVLKGVFADASALQATAAKAFCFQLSDADSLLLWQAIEQNVSVSESLGVLKGLSACLGNYDARYQYQPGLFMKQLAAYDKAENGA